MSRIQIRYLDFAIKVPNRERRNLNRKLDVAIGILFRQLDFRIDWGKVNALRRGTLNLRASRPRFKGLCT